MGSTINSGASTINGEVTTIASGLGYENVITDAVDAASGTVTRTVPVGKRWVILAAQGHYNGGASVIAINGNTCSYASAAATPGTMMIGPCRLEAGEQYYINRSGFVSYIEEDV